MRTVRYDIFSGHDARDGLWLDVADGLDAAREKMREFAAKERGAYFIYCVATREIVGSVDTTKPEKAEGRGAS